MANYNTMKARKFVLDHMPDSLYVKFRLSQKVGYNPNIRKPRTFNEKLQWLKLNERDPIYTTMVDKYAVKDYVANIIGEEYIIPTIGIWDSFDKIDFESLPEKFVMKCTHDSGGLVICKDKSRLDLLAAREKIEASLRNDYYKGGREWPYKNVQRRILVEKYMEDAELGDLRDYKIHCFNGIPTYIQTIGNRNHEMHTGNQMFYTVSWENAGWSFGDYPPYSDELEKPYNLEKMLEIATKLSEGLKYIRIDLYEINKKVYFGEITFFPGAGFYPYNGIYSYNTDRMLGDLIDLTDNSVK